MTALLTPFLVLLLSVPLLTLGKSVPRCRFDQHRCDFGDQCIMKAWMCDGMVDCDDGSDEFPSICHQKPLPNYGSSNQYRPYPLKCPENWFFCENASACVHPMDVCNGVNDCSDRSDEGPFCHFFREQNTRTQSTG
uniref:Uncharacterized protein n=1 Tax=Plectus sambesii TaxID=2011161 RepID=A0A914XFN3_9BILA